MDSHCHWVIFRWMTLFLKKKQKNLEKSLPKQISKPSQLKINFVVSLICEHNTKQICSDLGSILA